jgi:hypothetical protein
MRDLYSYSLSPDQFVAAVRRVTARMGERMHTRWFAEITAALFLVAVVAVAAHPLTDGRLLGAIGIQPGWLAAIAVACGMLSIFARHHGILLVLRRSTLEPGAWQLGVDDEGLWSQGPHGESFTRWSGWQSVEEHRDLVLLYHDNAHVQPIPFAAFATPEERREFIAHVRAKIAAQPGEMRQPGARPVAPQPGRPLSEPIAFAPGFRTLLDTAVKIATFRRIAQSQLAVTWVQILGIVLVTLVPPFAFALASVGEAGHLAWKHLPEVVFHVPMMLIAAIMVAHLIGRIVYVAPLFAAALLAWAVIDLFSLGLWVAARPWLDDHTAANMAFYYVPIAWLALAVTRLALSFVPAPSARPVWVLLACALFIALPMGGVWRERSLWSYDYGRPDPEQARAARASAMAAASEESFYRQPEILRRELSALQPGRKGVVDVFLVGVAGYGQQDVFMREVDSVAALFRERFDADGHIVTLVNNPKTVLKQPVASATSLEAALKRVAQAMDGEEDVLVLFLTSHGSNDHQFTMQLWPLDLKQITPHMLRQMLDASGIKHRVVIVSACYAGGFIRQLEGENTLVIAAAAPDRNSFGCSNEADWTYFGKAYFDQALRQTASFTRAFEIARPLIEERERSGNHEPSNPQISLGAAVKVKLEELERQLGRD